MQVPHIAMLALWLVLPGCGRAQTADPNAPLVLERTIPLEGVSGRIDHLAADPAHHRIFIAELGNGSVDVVDLDSGSTRRISGLPEPQGVGYLPGRNEIVVACGGDGSVRFYDAASLAQTGTIALGHDADNVRIDPATGEVVVGYGGGAIAFVDAARRQVVKTIALPAHPEGFRIDAAAKRVFVNLPNAGSIAVVDEATGKLIAEWKAANLMNFPMAIDPAEGALAIVYRWPARLDLVDGAAGKVRQELPTCGDADDVYFDQRRRRIYVSCGSGEVDVFQKAGANYTHMDAIATGSGARTALLVPELDRLFVAKRAGRLGSGAGLLVFRPSR